MIGKLMEKLFDLIFFIIYFFGQAFPAPGRKPSSIKAH